MWLRQLGVVGAALTIMACGGDDSADHAASGRGGDGGGAGMGGPQGGDGGSGLAASGGTAGLSTSGGTAGVPAAGGSGGNGSGASSGGAGAGSGGSAAGAGARGSGRVTVLTMLGYQGAGSYLTSVSARFLSAEARATMPCVGTEHGACKVYGCDPSPSTAGVEAGAITAQSAEVSFAQTIVTNDQGFYQSYSLFEPVFLGGEAIAVSATGGNVPAFTAELSYPALLLLTTPASFDVNYPISVPSGQDFTLGWDRGATDVSFQLQGGTADLSVVCSQPSESGSLVVPQAALAALPSGTTFDLFTLGKHDLVAGDYDVTVVAAGAVMAPNMMNRIVLTLE